MSTKLQFFLLIAASVLDLNAQVFIPFSHWGCKTDLLYSDNSSTDFTAGNLTNVSWGGSGLALNAGQSIGSVTSRVIDTNNTCVSSFKKYSWVTNLPAGKEIAPSAETGYGATPADFSVSVAGYWKLNEASATGGAYNDFTDSSGQNNHGEVAGALSFGQTGKLNKAIALNGGAANYIDILDSATLDNSNKMSFSFWIYPTILDGNPRAVLSKRISSGAGLAYGFFMYTGNRLNIDLETTNNRFASNTVFVINTWYHVVVVYDGTLALAANRAALYVNGILDRNGSETSTSISNSTANAAIGFMAGQTFGFSGTIDDVVIWRGRSLTAVEVLELYRRGAHRLKFQFRSCTASDCSDAPAWIGPDGSSSTEFSETNNNSLPQSGLGTVQTLGPAMTLSDFPFVILLGNRYFQYTVTFESENTTSSPQLNSVQIMR